MVGFTTFSGRFAGKDHDVGKMVFMSLGQSRILRRVYFLGLSFVDRLRFVVQSTAVMIGHSGNEDAFMF